MRPRNIDNLAVLTGHLYTRVIEFRISHVFLSLYIYPPARIITQ